MNGTTLVKLQDGTLIEVTVPSDQAQPIAGGFAKKVNAAFANVRPLIDTIVTSAADITTMTFEGVHIEKAEIEVGIGFEAEGNLYITKTSASGNLRLKIIVASK